MTDSTAPLRPMRSLALLRCLVAMVMFIHGTYRLSHAGYVSGFGGFLVESGVPFGATVAWVITLWECTASLVLASGWRQRWVALGFALELTSGIIMVHLQDGWFVVGGGRNGAEYSVVLIGVLLAVAYAEPRFKAA